MVYFYIDDKMSEEDIRQQFYTVNDDGSSTCKIPNTEISKIAIGDNGMAQVTFDVYESSVRGYQSVSVTYNPSDPSSMQNIFAMNVGSGGYSDVGIDLDGTALNEESNHITITYHDAYTYNSNTNTAVKDVLSLLSDEYNIEYNRMISSGASAGAQNSANLAILCQDIVEQPIDIMLIDAADDASRFTNHLLSNNELLTLFKENGGTIYAYEADRFSYSSAPSAALAKNNLKKLADAGLNLILVENPKANFHMAPYAISVKSGEVDNLFNNFNQSLIIRQTDGNNDYTLSQCFNGYNQYANENVYKYYSNGEWHKISTFGINRLLNSQYNSLRSKYHNLTQLQTINNVQDLNNMKNISYSDNLPISIEFISATNSTNSVISAISKTTFLNEGFNYQLCESTSIFPDSLNNSNAFLFNTSGKLLTNLAQETVAIERILRNYSYLDKDLAFSAQMLGNGIGGNIIINDATSQSARTIEIDRVYLDSFPTNINIGSVGTINIIDIDNLLVGGELGGIIGNSLQNEIDDANYLKEVLNELINDPSVNGPGWDSVKKHLNNYNSYCDMRINAAHILQEAYKKSLNMIKEYMDPYTELDDSKIDELKENIFTQERIIQHLKTRANYYYYETRYEEGNVKYEYGYQVKVYPYKFLLNQIPAHEEIIDEIQKMLNKLEGLAPIMNEANQIIQDAIYEVNSLYNTPISQINPITVAEYSSVVLI